VQWLWWHKPGDKSASALAFRPAHDRSGDAFCPPARPKPNTWLCPGVHEGWLTGVFLRFDGTFRTVGASTRQTENPLAGGGRLVARPVGQTHRAGAVCDHADGVGDTGGVFSTADNTGVQDADANGFCGAGEFDPPPRRRAVDAKEVGIYPPPFHMQLQMGGDLGIGPLRPAARKLAS